MLSAPSIIFFDGPYVIDGRTLLIIHSISKMVLKTAEGTPIFGETSRVENFPEYSKILSLYQYLSVFIIPTCSMFMFYIKFFLIHSFTEK